MSFAAGRLLSKHLVDIDDEVLGAARAELGTGTIKETVNEALRRASVHRSHQLQRALDVLANAPLADREEAWHSSTSSTPAS